MVAMAGVRLGQASNWTPSLNTSTASVGVMLTLTACTAACLKAWMLAWKRMKKHATTSQHGSTPVEWVWQGDDEEEEEEEEGECDTSFVVVQAFDTDSNAIANELFVYVLGYNEDNDFLGLWRRGFKHGSPANLGLRNGRSLRALPDCDR